MSLGTNLSAVDAPRRPWERDVLFALLLVSAALRVILAVRGGQYFWTDESRYVVAKAAASDFAHGHLHAGLDRLFASADHLLFKVVGIIPAFVQLALGDSPVIAALFFGIFSVGLIWLSWCLARSRGASAREALFTAFLVAATNFFFYYARHLFPYDLSLCLFLGGALLGFRRGSLSHFGAGLLAGFGFLAYNGYWLFGGTVLALTVLDGNRTLAARARQAGCSLLGLFLPILGVLGLGRAFGHDLLRSFVEFSQTVGGDRGNAWRMIPEYYWASEHALALFWGFAVVAALGAWLAGMLEDRARTWLLGCVLFAGGIVGLSDLVQKFSAYGRHSRPLALFLCLLGGWVLEKIYRSGPKGAVTATALVSALAAQAVCNFRPPLNQEFPPGFAARAAPVIAADLRARGGFYRVLVEGLYENRTDKAARNHPHTVLLQSAHPYQFQPYAFDGFNEKIRADFRRSNFSMLAVRLEAEAPGGRDQFTRFRGPWERPLGPLRLELIFNPTEPAVADPLVSSGAAGAGDQIFAQFTSPGHLRLGFDHWNNPVVFSRIFPCDPRVPHVLVVSDGALVPATDPVSVGDSAAWRTLRHWVFVSFDGQTALKIEAETFPADPGTVAILHNFIGFSSSGRDFSGRILSVSRTEPADVVGALGFALRPAQGRWAPYPGPLRMQLYFPADSASAMPLVGSGQPGAGDQVFARFLTSQQVQIGYDHWGHPALLSPPFACDPSQPHTLVISYGALYPAEADPPFPVHPEWRWLKQRVFVSLDGQTVLEAEAKAYAASPESITFLHNRIGFGSSDRDFTGTLVELASAPLESIPSPR